MFTQYSQPRGEDGLTSREVEILQLLVDGLSKKHVVSTLTLKATDPCEGFNPSQGFLHSHNHYFKAVFFLRWASPRFNFYFAKRAKRFLYGYACPGNQLIKKLSAGGHLSVGVCFVEKTFGRGPCSASYETMDAGWSRPRYSITMEKLSKP